MALSSRELTAPAAALARWRALDEQRRSAARPVDAVVAWLRSQEARMLATGGRVAELMTELGICDLETITECLHAQLDAERPGDEACRGPQLRDMIESDLERVVLAGPPEVVRRLLGRLTGAAWENALDETRAALAVRSFELGNDVEGEAMMGLVRGHPLLTQLLASYGPRLTLEGREATRSRIREELRRLPSTWHPSYRAALVAKRAVDLDDRRLLNDAILLLDAIPPAERDHDGCERHPVVEIACALATFGELDDAVTIMARLPDEERFMGLLHLVPLLRKFPARAALVDELVRLLDGGTCRLDGNDYRLEEECWLWGELVLQLPETATRVLPRILTLDDAQERFDTLPSVVKALAPEQAEPLWRWMLDHARSEAIGTELWVENWRLLLWGLEGSGCESLLDDAVRRWLVDESLARPEIDLWASLLHFLPDDRVLPVLELACRKVMSPYHGVRDVWMDIGWELLPRVAADWAARWPTVAAEALERSGALGDSRNRTWTPAQWRRICLASIRSHQQQFLPEQMIFPWLSWLCSIAPPALTSQVEATIGSPKIVERVHPETPSLDLPIVVATDPEEQAACRATLDRLLAEPGWPSTERVGWVVAFLGRCSGEGALLEVARGLVEMTAEIDREDWREGGWARG